MNFQCIVFRFHEGNREQVKRFIEEYEKVYGKELERKAEENNVGGNLELKEESSEYHLEQEKTINKKHDKIFKDILSNKEEVTNFINTYFKSKMKLKPEDIEPYKTDYVTSEYKSKEADIVYKIKDMNSYILIEHQSTIDRTMPYRITNYIQAITNHVVDKKLMRNKDYKYPEVTAIVIYTGKEKWNVSLRFNNIKVSWLDYEDKKEDYRVVDINDYGKEELMKEKSVLSKAMIMEKSRSKEESIENAEAVIRNLQKSKEPLADHFIEVILKYMLESGIREEVVKRIENLNNEKGEDSHMMNFVREIMEENEALERKGYEKGKAEGKAEGKVAKEKSIVKRLIARKMSIKDIASIVGISEKKVNEIKEQVG